MKIGEKILQDIGKKLGGENVELSPQQIAERLADIPTFLLKKLVGLLEKAQEVGGVFELGSEDLTELNVILEETKGFINV